MPDNQNLKEELERLSNELKDVKERMHFNKELSMSQHEVNFETFIQKHDFKDWMEQVAKKDQKINKLLKALEEERYMFIKETEDRMKKLEVIGEMYRNVMENTPILMNDIELSKEMKKRLEDMEDELK